MIEIQNQMSRSLQIAVCGGGSCSAEVYDTARSVGRIIALHGHTLICGGLGGVMEAAACGAKEAGGLVVGILPGDRAEANPYLDVAIGTGMAHARNVIIVRSADAVIALPGKAGTLSEIAIALKIGCRVISLGSWNVLGVLEAATPEDAVDLAEEMIDGR